MIFSRWTFQGKSKRILEDIMPKAKQIEALSDNYRSLSNHELKEIMFRNRRLIQDGALSLDDAMIEVYACIIEASSRILGKRHFFQQILGGIVVHSGRVAELKTGEGKTLMSTLPIILNALNGYGVHCVTVNDYLAERDCKLNRPLYEFFSLSNGYITNDTDSGDKQRIYDMDITYCTASRMAFDFLESHMASSYDEKYRFACKFMCVDECDYLLIDEAKVPLIISSQSNEDNEMYIKFNPVIQSLKINHDFTINLKGKTAWLTPSGFDKVESFARDSGLIIGGLFSSSNIDYFHIISNLLRAHFVMIQNKDYVVHDGQIVIIDEATGRLAVGKKYSHGIHQAIESKEGVKISKSTTISASITYPNFFRMYEKIGGMTGTGMTEANELKEVYGLEVVQIPTHKPVQRIDEPFARLYRTKNDMFEDIAKLVNETNKTGQPILIGTESVLASETLSAILSKHRIRHSVLNAKNHKEEASIIAQAGKKYAVTISTNMAGRGVDIALGGNPEEAANDLAEREHENREYVLRILREKVARERQEVMNLGGLLVIVAGTLNNKKDEQQLFGRAGRQGNPGRSVRFSSLEDSVMSEDNKILQQFITLSCQLDEDSSLVSDDGGRYICNANSNQIIDTIQQGKQDSSYETRKHLLKFDNTIHKQRKVIYELRDYILLTNKLIELVISFGRSLVDKIYSEHIKYSYESFIDQVNDIFQEQCSYADKLNDVKNKISDKIYNVLIHKGEDEIRQHIIRTFDRCFKSIINKYEDLKRTIFIVNYNQDDPYIKYAEIAYKMFMESIKEIEMGVMQMITSGRSQSNDSLFDFDMNRMFGGRSQFTNKNSSDPFDDILSRIKKNSVFGGKDDEFDDLFSSLRKRINDEDMDNDTDDDTDEDMNEFENKSIFDDDKEDQGDDSEVNSQENTGEVDDFFAQLAKRNRYIEDVPRETELKDTSVKASDSGIFKSHEEAEEIFKKTNRSLEQLIASLLSDMNDGEMPEPVVELTNVVEQMPNEPLISTRRRKLIEERFMNKSTEEHVTKLENDDNTKVTEDVLKSPKVRKSKVKKDDVLNESIIEVVDATENNEGIDIESVVKVVDEISSKKSTKSKKDVSDKLSKTKKSKDLSVKVDKPVKTKKIKESVESTMAEMNVDSSKEIKSAVKVKLTKVKKLESDESSVKSMDGEFTVESKNINAVKSKVKKLKSDESLVKSVVDEFTVDEESKNLDKTKAKKSKSKAEDSKINAEDLVVKPKAVSSKTKKQNDSEIKSTKTKKSK
jgi:preprotein translocase subunit SecA